jgi:hypothetical protein
MRRRLEVRSTVGEGGGCRAQPPRCCGHSLDRRRHVSGVGSHGHHGGDTKLTQPALGVFVVGPGHAHHRHSGKAEPSQGIAVESA